MSHKTAYFSGSVYSCTGVTNEVTDYTEALQEKAYPSRYKPPADSTVLELIHRLSVHDSVDWSPNPLATWKLATCNKILQIIYTNKKYLLKKAAK